MDLAAAEECTVVVTAVDLAKLLHHGALNLATVAVTATKVVVSATKVVAMVDPAEAAAVAMGALEVLGVVLATKVAPAATLTPGTKEETATPGATKAVTAVAMVAGTTTPAGAMTLAMAEVTATDLLVAMVAKAVTKVDPEAAEDLKEVPAGKLVVPCEAIQEATDPRRTR